MKCPCCGSKVETETIQVRHHSIERPVRHAAPCGRRCIGGGLTGDDKHRGEHTFGPAIKRAHRRSGCEVCGRADSSTPAWQWRRALAKGEA